MQGYNVGSPFEMVVIDISRSFPWTDGGNKHSIVGLFKCGIWPAKQTVLWSSLFEVPLGIYSDQNRNLKKTGTTSLHQSSHGNRQLAKFVSDHRPNWAQQLRLPCDLKFGCRIEEVLNEDDYVSNLSKINDQQAIG